MIQFMDILFDIKIQGLNVTRCLIYILTCIPFITLMDASLYATIYKNTCKELYDVKASLIYIACFPKPL